MIYSLYTIKIPAVILSVALFSFIAFASSVSAATTAELQAQIEALQKQLVELLAKVSASQQGGGTSVGVTASFTRTLSRGSTDAETGGEVTQLQKFLADNPSIYPEGLITGYFGALTERAVGRWQAAKGIVSSGTPETTGYGLVGPKTRAFLNAAVGAGIGSSTGTGTGTSGGVSANNPVITSITPLSGNAGTQIILVGTGFSATNTIHFGPGILPPLKSDNGTHLVFSVPSVLTLSCFYTYLQPPCLGTTQLLTGGSYSISVSNENGTSNAVIFFVEQNLSELQTSHSGNITINRPLSGSASGFNTITVFGKGFANSPEFRYPDLPSGISASTTTPCIGLPCAVTNTIIITSTSTEGTFPISVVTSTGGMTSTSTFNLIIAPPVPFDFFPSLSGNITATQPFSGSISASNTISTTFSGGPAQKITFTQSGLPSGVTGNIPSCTPVCTSTNTLTIGSSAVPGTYSVTVSAATASTTKMMTYTLTINSKSVFGFHLEHSGNVAVIKPSSGTITATNTISAVLDGGVGQNVSFSQSGFPSGVSAASLSSCFLSCVKTNTITVNAATPPGTYPIMVSSTGGGITSTTVYNLVVLPYTPFSFDISVSGDVTITRPVSGTASQSNSVTVNYNAGTAQKITFVHNGFPSGAGFSIGQCTPTCTVTNTLSVSSFTPIGEYNISLSAQGGGASATTTYMFKVQ